MTSTLRRRTVLRAGALALTIPCAHSANAEIALSAAINRAGRLRALSQRSAKAYSQEFMGVLPEQAREIAQVAQRLITGNLEELARSKPPAEVVRLVQRAAEAAADLRVLMAATRNKEGALAVSRQADALLDAAEQATAGYEALGNSGSAKLINVAGRQRMLSQRMTKNYFLIAAGHHATTRRDQIESDRAAFAQALALLNGSALSTSGIRNELVQAQNQWIFFEAAVSKLANPDTMRIVATSSERLLETMNNLTELYDAALKDLLGRA